MLEFLEGADPMIKTFWYIAIPSSLIFIIQAIMTFIGIDGGDGLHSDFDSDLDADGPFQLFSFRNLINFLLGFSWTGLAFQELIHNKALLAILAVVVGSGFVAIFFSVMKQINKLAEDNTFTIDKAVNQVAEVYLTIPQHNAGKGKVLVSINGSVKELDAITNSNERIPSGTMVRITGVTSGNLLIVEKI